MIIYQGPERRRAIVNDIYNSVKPYLVRSDSVRIVVGRYTKVDITGSGISVEGDRELYRKIDAGEDCAPLHFLEDAEADFGSRYDELTDMIIIDHDLLKEADDAQQLGQSQYFDNMRGGFALPFVCWDLGNNRFHTTLRDVFQRMGFHFKREGEEDYTFSDYVNNGEFSSPERGNPRKLQLAKIISETDLPHNCAALALSIGSDLNGTDVVPVRSKLKMIHRNLDFIYAEISEGLNARHGGN